MLAKGIASIAPHFLFSRRSVYLYMIATSDSFEPHSGDALPNSTKTYVPGNLFPDLRVPFREISLNPTRHPNGRSESNASMRVYDCSGPWGDAAFLGTVREGLPALRRDWILGRGDVEEVSARATAHRGERR